MTAALLLIGFAGLAGGLLLMLLPRAPATAAGALLFGGLGVLGLALWLLSFADLWQGWRSQRWPVVDGVVVSSRAVELSPWRGSRPTWRAELVYRYTAPGQAPREHQASRQAFGEIATPDREAVLQDLATRFAPGAALRVHVNPADPAEAVLLPGPQAKAGIIAALGTVFVLLGAWQLGRLLRDGRGNGGPPHPSRPLTRRQRRARDRLSA